MNLEKLRQAEKETDQDGIRKSFTENQVTTANRFPDITGTSRL